jgi:hypothetical protein
MYVVWPPRGALQLRQNLDDLFWVVNGGKGSDASPEVRSWLSRLLVVRSCGYLEKMVLLVCAGYIEEKSGGPVRSFARSQLGRLNANVGPGSLVELVRKFDPDLEADLTRFLDEENQRVRRELDFLVRSRNRIAHGESENINPRKALDLKEIACEVVDWFILSFNPARA